MTGGSAERRERTTPAEWAGVGGLLVVSALVRVPFWPRYREADDALNYAIGALYTHVAHPPGSVGYCLLLGAINHLVGDISVTMVAVSFVAAMAAIVLCHQVAKAMGLSPAGALAAAGAYGFSVATLHASLFPGPHELEGMMSLAVGLFAWRAVRDGSVPMALAASAAFALGGAIRPTTTLLLAPLWAYMVFAARREPVPRYARVVAMHLLVVVPIVAAWSWANGHYMRANGYGGRTYQDQVLSSSQYDYTAMSATARDRRAVAAATFHMPAAEVLAWAEVKTGLRLMPHTPDWPVPSLARAAKLTAMQAAKQAWWVTLSVPLFWLVLAVAIVRRRAIAWPTAGVNGFVGLWVLPAAVFFVVGHMGTLTYVQVYLGGLCVWVVAVLTGPASRPTRFGLATVTAGVVLNLAFYGLTRPFHATAGAKRLADVLALQFDGAARREAFATSRSNGHTGGGPDSAVGPDRDYLTADSDAALLDAARRNGFPYAVFPPKVADPSGR